VKKLLLVSAMLLVVNTAADAQSWGRGGGYTGAGSNEVRRTGLGYYPRTGTHSCTWSATAACAAWRNGNYTHDGVTHKLAGVKPNGRFRVHVYLGNTRVK
jgi:hypothetical protein